MVDANGDHIVDKKPIKFHFQEIMTEGYKHKKITLKCMKFLIAQTKGIIVLMRLFGWNSDEGNPYVGMEKGKNLAEIEVYKFVMVKSGWLEGIQNDILKERESKIVLELFEMNKAMERKWFEFSKGIDYYESDRRETKI